MKQLVLALIIILASCKDAKKSEMAPIDKTSENEVITKERALFW